MVDSTKYSTNLKFGAVDYSIDEKRHNNTKKRSMDNTKKIIKSGSSTPNLRASPFRW